MRIRSRRGAARPGFTFVEMIFAVGIILVLILLSAAAIVKFRNTGPYVATAANLDKLKRTLDTQWQAVREKAQRDPIDVSAGSLGVSNLASPDARANFISARLAQAFPISFIEVFKNTGACGPWPPYVSYLKSLGVQGPTDPAPNFDQFAPEVQQGVCLLMILEIGPQNGGLKRDVLGTSLANTIQFNPQKVAGLPSGPVFSCVDAWGWPLLFTRAFWKTGNNTLGLVSLGPDGKAGVTITLGNAGTHSLKPLTSDADDNVVNPDLP
jgi:hypothetical protein